jgi:predicted nucleic acid-binding protein
MRVARSLDDAHVVTTDPVLTEVLAYVSERGPVSRTKAVATIDALRDDAAVTIVRQTPELFDAGLNLYRRRPDKGYSLTDCMSMIVCQQFDISDVLTHDRHFEQEGFTILL